MAVVLDTTSEVLLFLYILARFWANGTGPVSKLNHQPVNVIVVGTQISAA